MRRVGVRIETLLTFLDIRSCVFLGLDDPSFFLV